MHGLLITDPTCHLPAGALKRFPIDRLTPSDTFDERLSEQWLYHCDALLGIGSTLSIESWQTVIAQRHDELSPRRLSAHLRTPFYVRLFHSQHQWAALGLLVKMAADRLEKGNSLDAIRSALASTEARIHHLLAMPAGSTWLNETMPLFQRWRRRNAAMVHLQPDRRPVIQFTRNPILAVLEHGRRLAPPKSLFNLSYAGDLASLQTQTAFRQWHQNIRRQGSQCWLSAMDDASSEESGRGALSLAWLSEPAHHETP
ncbi:hypothetical protein BGP77_03060 [Saccharospirillum sp. MSK14-1]|uniref:hypothetical protein n=1 Tax=Saccharospirillum sp. MSK14-1 TaxID=1897632 RepID=UPI000D354DFB|nr:hypothetical protein [Saccharospirillum sp. MSK14-1]PTY36303.1 hypothetical protein BGP77_03060 [Saccharospirillum sp. MSK14-1]